MKSKLSLFLALILFLVFTGLFLNVGNITPAPHFDDLNSGSLLDSIYAVLLASLVLFVAAGLGMIFIRPFKLLTWTFLECAAFGLPLGLAAIAFGEFFLGLIGWIRPVHQIIFLVVVTGIAYKNSVLFLREGLTIVKDFGQAWRTFSRIKKFFLAVGGLALLLALFQTFTPPYDYDGLMYHLQGPSLFLKAGRIIPIPENFFTYYPAAWEMLYMLGMGLGSDIFARLISFSTLLIFLLVTYLFGKRFLPAPGGLISVAIVMSVPMMLVWGGIAYIDLAWSLFQILAVGLLLIWIQDGDDKLLVLSGIMQGLALGSKYFAFSGAAIIVLFIVWFGIKNRKKQKDLFKGVISPLLKFGVPAILVASPWYLKNFIWTGNPIFPLVFHQEIVNPSELKIWLDYLASFGTGTHWSDYLLLPITIFSNSVRYSTFVVFWDFPNPIMLMALIYPLIRKKITKSLIVLDTLAIITALQFVGWSLSSQQSRFLMPLFPGLSIIASIVILKLPLGKFNINWSRIISIGAVGGLVIGLLLQMIGISFIVKPYNVLFKKESKADFLSAMLRDYQAVEYINKNLPENALVFLPWDGRGYYCDGKCYSDISQSAWTALIQETQDVNSISAWLTAKGMTHILLSLEDVAFFIHGHDPNDVHQQALSYLLDDYAPRCAEVVYEDEWTRLYELHPESSTCQ